MKTWQNPTAQAAPSYPQGYGAPAPSGATAITASVLSLLGGAGQLFGAFTTVAALATISQATSLLGTDGLPGWYGGTMTVTVIVQFALAAALLVGGGALLTRKLWARIVIAGACGVALALGIVGLLIAAAVSSHIPSEYATGQGFSMIIGIMGLIFPVATAVLALLPSTRQWCQTRTPAATAW